MHTAVLGLDDIAGRRKFAGIQPHAKELNGNLCQQYAGNNCKNQEQTFVSMTLPLCPPRRSILPCLMLLILNGTYVIQRPKRLEKSGIAIELKSLCNDATL
jgi:hypothetical protein